MVRMILTGRQCKRHIKGRDKAADKGKKRRKLHIWGEGRHRKREEFIR